jgi:hypothetical protein
MKVGTRLGYVLACAGLIGVLPAFGTLNAAAASRAAVVPSLTSSHVSAFPTLSNGERVAAGKQFFHRGGSARLTLRGTSDVAGSSGVTFATTKGSDSHASAATSTPLITSTSPDDLTGFAGTAQASTIHSFGGDQEVTPPNEDLAAGPADLVEVVNSSVEVFTRSGAPIGADDLNDFMDVDVQDGYRSSDPRVIYDVGSGRFWITITEVPSSGCPGAAPVLIAVSASSNPLPFNGWLVYALPTGLDTPGTLFGDQPGLGADSNTIAVTFNDFSCNFTWLGSEVDILQKSDLETGTGSNTDDWWDGGPFASQPVQSFGTMPVQYVVTNESDCGSSACASPEVEVDTFTGTPEGVGGVTLAIDYVPMAATAVNDTTGLLPPADQKGTSLQLQTNDDRFLNAVWENGTIWTADATSCEPSGDTKQRACLDYVEISADNAGNVSATLANQINNVGINGADLFYPAVSLDAAGNLFTVFDESSTSLLPSILAAAIPAGGSTLTAFETLHTSSTYYDGDLLFAGACGTNGCRWGDYSGAAQDPANPNDVWVVSGSEDGTVEGTCTQAQACWNTRINQLTLSGPTIASLTPDSGPVAGGQTVTVRGFDFASDTTVSFAGSPVTPGSLTPESFTFVTPPSAPAGGSVQTQATDSLGTSVEDAASSYTYVGLANYVALAPFRILDTRSNGGPLGPGSVRTLQVTGVGSTPVPSTATAVVLNVTEVNGSAASLLTVYPLGATRPNASNLNFAAHTVIANLVTVSLAPPGEVEIYNALGSVNVLADVEGYFTPEPSSDDQGLFHPITPLRVCDTRSTSHTPACRAHGTLGAEAAMPVNVTGSGSGVIPGDGTAEAAVLNITGVAGSGGTYLSVFPTDSTGGCAYTGSHAPPVSTLNLPAGAVAANRVMVELGPATTGGADTSVCVYNSVGTINVILDANGWFGSSTATSTPAGYQYQALVPTRICDTRVGYPACTKGAIGPASSRLIDVAGNGLVPVVGSSTVVVAVIANLTAVAPSQGTYLTLYPSDPGAAQTPPLASDLNVNANENLPNLAVVQLDTTAGVHDGYISLFNSVGSVNAVIDLEGWFQ